MSCGRRLCTYSDYSDVCAEFGLPKVGEAFVRSVHQWAVIRARINDHHCAIENCEHRWNLCPYMSRPVNIRQESSALEYKPMQQRRLESRNHQLQLHSIRVKEVDYALREHQGQPDQISGCFVNHRMNQTVRWNKYRLDMHPYAFFSSDFHLCSWPPHPSQHIDHIGCGVWLALAYPALALAFLVPFIITLIISINLFEGII